MERTLLPLLATLLLLTTHAAAERTVSMDMTDTPLPAALTRLQDASGLHLVFSDDLVRDAEPVTLSAKDEPVGDVLLRMLRPRGLECIYTGETMAAIVPAATDEGMAKASGRALRTFARLDPKVENARQVGDEVQVPDWTDADDRALAEALVDILSAIFFADHHQRTSPTLIPDVLKMLDSYDQDVRVGCIIAAIEGGWRPETDDDGLRLREAVRKMSADPDPAIRAIGTFLWIRLRPLLNQKWQLWALDAGPAMYRAANDSAPEVRFATALLCGFDPKLPEGPALLETFRTDGNAAVRFISWLFRLESVRLQPDSRALAGGILKDPNPIARVLGILGPCILYGSRAQEHVDELISPDDLANDPWLKAAADLYVPLSRFANSRYHDAPAVNESAATNGPPAPAEQVPDPFVTVTRMTASGKRSHQALAAASFFLGMRITHGEPKPGEPKPDPASIMKLSESSYLWTRIVAIMACGTVDTPEGWIRVLTAIKSQDEPDRLAGFMACMARRPDSPAALPAGLKAAVLASLDAPTFPERTLATMAGANVFTFDEIMARFQDEARRHPVSDRAFMLLQVFRFHRDLTRYNEEVRTQRLLAMLDVVLESRNAALQTAFIRQMDWWLRQNQPLVLTFILESEPQALFDLITDHRLSPYPETFPIAAVLDRLKVLHGSATPAISEKAVSAFTAGIREAYLFSLEQEIRTSALALAETMLDDCLKNGAPEDKLAAGLELLTMLFSPYTPFKDEASWKDVPPGISRALIAGIWLAPVERHTSAVAALLSSCYRRRLLHIAQDPQVADAVDSARRAIMEKGKPADQVLVLCGAARDPDKAVSGMAAVELQKLLLTGKVPAELMSEAGSAAAHGPAPPELVPMLLERIADEGADKNLRGQALYALAQDPSQITAILDRLEPLAKANREFDLAPGLGSAIYRNLASIRERKEPEPAWAERAAALGMEIALDTARPLPCRSDGIKLYAFAAGPRSAEKLEAFINDEKLDPELRSAAAAMIIIDPETKIFVTMAGKYDTLPRPVRQALGSAASRAAKAPGAEAFLIRFLKDDDIELESRFSVLNQLGLFGAATQIAALKELENHPRIGSVVRGVIERIENRRKQ